MSHVAAASPAAPPLTEAHVAPCPSKNSGASHLWLAQAVRERGKTLGQSRPCRDEWGEEVRNLARAVPGWSHTWQGHA